jgi:hypothetical protein
MGLLFLMIFYHMLSQGEGVPEFSLDAKRSEPEAKKREVK